MTDFLQIDECLRLPKDVVQDAVDVFSDYYGVTVSLEQCAEIIKRHKTLAADLYASNSARDTCTREYLIDALTTEHLGMKSSWPCNGDSVERKIAFYTEFAEKTKAKGIGFQE